MTAAPQSTWDRRQRQREAQVASLMALGLSKDDARVHLNNEVGRAACRAKEAGAKLREIGAALGVTRSRAADHVRRGAILTRLDVGTPLEGSMGLAHHRRLRAVTLKVSAA